ncbi:hypothetical protein ACWD8L_34115 [Streptomyces sp. NPDC005133]
MTPARCTAPEGARDHRPYHQVAHRHRETGGDTRQLALPAGHF